MKDALDASLEKAPAPKGYPSWEGTPQYDVVRAIGRGGMGVVYEAFDRERRQRVALKTLLHFSPVALYQFKQEFRALADVQHPNLVRLHELVATDPDHTFFAMELVRGSDFLTHVWGGEKPGKEKSAHEKGAELARAHAARKPRDGEVTRPDRVRPSSADAAPETSTRGASPADLDRLRRALPQLVHGVHALHLLGKLHRDIKPSNVLVTAEGRVVILDFGIAAHFSRVVDENLIENVEGGTPSYMAPEQASDEAPLPASDWYSVGVMLYEALVGRAPFAGSAFDIITDKNSFEAPFASEMVDGVPEDLALLCRDLLDRNPAHRPSALEILRRLGNEASVAPTPLPVFAPGAVAPALVGRGRTSRRSRPPSTRHARGAR